MANKQDNILNKSRKNNYKVKIYLVNGKQLSGQIEGFDNFVVILNKNMKQNMIYKHAISTVIF